MPRISKKRSISPNFSLYNNRGEYDNGADYFTGDLVYYAGDWWHCYDSAHLSPGYPPPSRPGNFVQITFKNKTISKTTEVKNLIAGIASLNTQKNQIENFDPYFENVSLLLPFDGDFQDYSKNNFNITVNGSPQISTAQSKFGGFSAYFNGSSALNIPTSITQFNANQDFTIECWAYLNSYSLRGIIGTYDFGRAVVGVDSSGTLLFSRANVVAVAQSSSGAISLNTWYHIAVTRSGSTVRLFIDGDLVGTATDPNEFLEPTQLQVGHFAGEGSWWWDGYLDDFRITKGVARYTSNFIPPSKISIEQIQIQNQLTQKQNTLAKKVAKTETKVNQTVVTKIVEKITAVFAILSTPENYGLVSVNDFNFNSSIKFNSSTRYNAVENGGGNGSWQFRYGSGLGAYFSSKFVIFKGEQAVNGLSPTLSITTDSRGYYAASIVIVRDNSGGIISTTGKFRTNWIKYKRTDIWCLYDAENDIMYYNNYTGGDYVPTKKWYRADILYKTEIELEKAARVSSNESESGSGSGSSGTGGAVGINILDSITSDADKIIWDYSYINPSEARFEPYGNYLLKTTLNRPIISTEIQSIVNDGTANYFIIYPNSGLSTQGGGFSSVNPVYAKPQQYSINSSSSLIMQRDYLGQGPIGIPNMIYAIETHNLEFPIASLQTMPTANGTITGFILHPQSNNGLSYQPNRTPIKILKGAYPYYYELYEDGKMFSVNANFSASELKFRSRQEIDSLVTQQNIAFTVYATGVFNAFSEGLDAISILTQNNTFKVNYQYATEEYALPSGVTKENVSKIVINRGRYPVDAYVYILDNSNNLHFNRSLDNSWSIIDTGVRDITYNSELKFVGIKMDYTFKRYPDNNSFYQENPYGIIIAGNKYRLISPKYAVRHFE